LGLGDSFNVLSNLLDFDGAAGSVSK